VNTPRQLLCVRFVNEPGSFMISLNLSSKAWAIRASLSTNSAVRSKNSSSSSSSNNKHNGNHSVPQLAHRLRHRGMWFRRPMNPMWNRKMNMMTSHRQPTRRPRRLAMLTISCRCFRTGIRCGLRLQHLEQDRDQEQEQDRIKPPYLLVLAWISFLSPSSHSDRMHRG